MHLSARAILRPDGNEHGYSSETSRERKESEWTIEVIDKRSTTINRGEEKVKRKGCYKAPWPATLISDRLIKKKKIKKEVAGPVGFMESRFRRYALHYPTSRKIYNSKLISVTECSNSFIIYHEIATASNYENIF